MSGTGWSLRGNGSIAVICLGLPVTIAIFEFLLARRLRREPDMFRRRWITGAIALVPFAVITGIATANWGTPAWASGNLMGRSDHTAVLLPDGRVLVGGGLGWYGQLATTSMYDPTANRWSQGPSLTHPRSTHAATLLSDGRVLVAGGCCGRGATQLTQDEILDTGLSRWTVRQGPGLERMSHSAFALPDGRVLVLGGTPPDDADRPVIFDSASGWQKGPRMLAGRTGINATLLRDGRILASGGFQTTQERAAEIYDPVSDTWRATSGSGATLPGMTGVALNDGRALILGGGQLEERQAAAVYDPAGDLWRAVATPVIARQGATATTLGDGRVLLAGGTILVSPGPMGRPTRDTELFDPATSSWLPGPEMRAARSGHTATVLNDGRVLLVGGWDRDRRLTTAEIYDPASNTWLDAGSMGSF